ncbi:MAG: TonB-dependent receptor [Opitutaceae bacterium]|nr:TonB-dependent receptor [Opitutaceae bacterium]
MKALRPLGVIAAFPCAVAWAQVAPSAPPVSTDTPVVLSPFQVDAGSDRGYLATQTLSGTRLKTDLKDIGSSLTIFTEELLNDLGANSIYAIMAFAPNTDPFIMSTSDITGNGNDFINIGTKFVSRGGASTVVGQDFFTNNIPQDRYNSEALTFTRGPNAILFGLGNAAGAFVSSTKRAKFADARSVEQQMDDRGGHRLTLDVNQVLVKKRLALRYSALFEGLNDFRIQNNTYQRRHFGTLTFTPFARTTLRVNYEHGHIQQSAVRPWPDYDAVSPWLAAGSPMIATFTNVAAGKPAGTQNFNYAGLTSTEFTGGGTPIPTQRLTNQGQSVPTSFANGFPVNGTMFRSLVNPAIYPTMATAFGNSAYRLYDFDLGSVFLEQQITRDFFIEAAFNKVDTKNRSLNGFVGQNPFIYVDVNRQLPNGQPNPNAGLLYSQSQGTIIEAPNQSEGTRVMASYEFDFAKRFRGFARHFGRHQTALFTEQNNASGWSSNNSEFNTTPLNPTGATAAITNGQNAIQYRFYYEPARNKVGTSVGRHLEAIPVLYANDPLPPRHPSGVTPAFVAQQGPTMTESIVKTRAVALQSFLWNNRLVVTNGYRTDDQTSWLAVPNDFASRRDANGLAPRPTGIALRQFPTQAGRTERGGHTFTRGVVFHALPWASLSWNTSNNFQVNAGTRNVFGDLLPNPEGTGSDFSLKLALLNRRLFLDITYYEIGNDNAADQISNNAAGNFKQFDQLWIGVANFTGDVRYLTSPYSTLSTVWQDVVSTTSKGWEFSLTANPTPQWRLTLNGSKRGDNTTTARGTYINAYMAHYIPIIKSHPEWLPVDAQGLTVGQRVAELENILVNFNAIRNSPSANFASNWTLNLIQTYEFPRDARLAGLPLGGFSFGGSMNARGKSIAGFAVDSRFVLDPALPYHAPAWANFGAWVTYKRKLFRNRLDWRLQMNVRNLLDENTVYPLVKVDSRDGRHTPSTAIYNLKEPRTYLFTSSFRF